jgi:hypothetical protein
MNTQLCKPSILSCAVLLALAVATLNGTTAHAIAPPSNAQIVTTLVAPLAAGGAPYAVSRDQNGNLLVPGNQSYTVKSVDATTNMITTLAGTGAYGYSGDGGQATLAKLRAPTFALPDSAGDIFVGGDSTIRKIDASTGVISTVVGQDFIYTYSGDGGSLLAATLGGPDAATFANNKLYFVDSGYGVIRFIDFAGDFIDLTAGTGSNAAYNGENIDAITANLSFPNGIVVDKAGNIYVTVGGHHIIRKITPDGKINTIAGIPTNQGFSGDGGSALMANLISPKGLTIDGVGNLYFSDSGSNRVRKISKTGIISTILGNGSAVDSGDGFPSNQAAVNAPWGVFIDSDGALLVSTFSSAVRRVAAPVVTLTSPNYSPTQNQPVTLTATLGDLTLTGAVDFQDAGVDIAGCVAVPVTVGVATCTTSFATAGKRTVSAGYSGSDITLGNVAKQGFSVKAGAPVVSIMPATFTASISTKSVGFGEITPLGVSNVFTGNVMAFSVAAYPRFVASVASTCNYKQTSAPIPLVPIGTGLTTFETEALAGDCAVEASFRALIPNINIAGAANAVALFKKVERALIYNAPVIPLPTSSAAGATTTFTAWVTNIAGVPYPSATNVITFTANGVAIPSCTAVPLVLRASDVLHIREASCVVGFANAGVMAIKAEFAGDDYNFPATPPAYLEHTVLAP